MNESIAVELATLVETEATEHEQEAARRMTGCDQCGPSVRAHMIATIGDGILKFCFHHTDTNRAAINAQGGFLYRIDSDKD